jgi:hypothetical protein
MPKLTWSLVKNLPNQCAEFAACHENFAWRKHHSSRFGQLKGGQKKCADDSLSRAFRSDQDSIPLLFGEGNRVMKNNPEYGRPVFVAVWYEGEQWAILCTSSEATLISTSDISEFKRSKERAAERISFLRRLWEASDPKLRIPLSSVGERIAKKPLETTLSWE